MKRIKRMNLSASIYADPSISEWLNNNTEWEARQRELYMKRAEEKWDYIRAVKARAAMFSSIASQRSLGSAPANPSPTN